MIDGTVFDAVGVEGVVVAEELDDDDADDNLLALWAGGTVAPPPLSISPFSCFFIPSMEEI